MKFGSGWSWLKILPLWIALMSGILSIVRETYGMFASSPVAPKSIFWECSRIAFILSAGIAWWQEHRALVAAQKALAAKTEELGQALKATTAGPGRTPMEVHQFAETEEALQRLGPGSRVVLRHLMNHGQFVINGMRKPPLPQGFDLYAMNAALNEAEREHLVKRTILQPGGETAFEISPGKKAALEELLYR